MVFGLFESDDDCGGGHVWGEWESTGYWNVSLYFNDDADLVRVFSERKRYCQHEDCDEVDHKKTFVGFIEDFEDCVETPDEIHERLGDEQ